MFCFALLSWLVSSTAIWSGGNASCHAGRPLEVYSTQIGEVWKNNFLANAIAMIAEEKMAHYHHDSRAVLPERLCRRSCFPTVTADAVD